MAKRVACFVAGETKIDMAELMDLIYPRFL